MDDQKMLVGRKIKKFLSKERGLKVGQYNFSKRLEL